ncbi:hypothetical protein ACIQJ4_03410 [Streptomyces filamentosus]|uniref:hypothetical protein n=1 Tax=Streptomyces filamentosus TaxID=67294 RepID=UPI0038095F2D
MTIFHRRVLATAAVAATAVLASAGAAAADSVGNHLPGLGLLSQNFGNGAPQAGAGHAPGSGDATDTLPTHDALNNVTLP